jgi:translation initiation factor 3 subunit J
MGDAWDDGDDDWDVDESELDKKLDMKKLGDNIPKFDDEEDLALKERVAAEKSQQAVLKKKGNVLAEKKRAEQDRLEELAIAKRAMELELDAESNLAPDQLRALKQKKIEEADNELTNDLFGGVDNKGKSAAGGSTTQSGDKVVMKDIKDHLKHARAVASCLRGHGNVHYATAFFKELIQQSKDVLDDDAVTELIKSLNVMKNEKVQAMKRVVKGQAQKAKKDKTAEAKARKIQVDTFGDNDQFDAYDAMGGDYEDAFF